MGYSIFFAIVLVLVSGFVAYFGDILGRKMGKKRLTLFHMRPRYTAIVVTTITGMLIAGFTLLIIALISPDFRKIFAEGKDILDRNARLTTSNATLEHRNQSLAQRSDFLEQEVKKSQKRLDEARADVAKAQKARDAAMKARDEARQTVNSLQKSIEISRNELETLRRQSDATNKQLADVQKSLAVKQAKLDDAESRLNLVEADLQRANSALDATRIQLTKADEKLKGLQQQYDDLQVKYGEQTSKLKEEGKRTVEFEIQTSQLRSKELVFRQGDELARGVISTTQTSFGIKADLYALLSDASGKARLMGARIGDNDRAVVVVYYVYYDPIEHKEKSYPESDCVKMALSTISSSYEDALVQIVCAKNTVAGEQVEVEFKLYVNTMVFSKGRLIASTKLDGAVSEGRILLSVINFLQKDVSEAALRYGIIPVANPDPRATLGKDPATQVEALMKLVDQVKAANSRVRLEAYAAEDVRAAGPISMENLRFEVDPVK